VACILSSKEGHGASSLLLSYLLYGTAWQSLDPLPSRFSTVAFNSSQCPRCLRHIDQHAFHLPVPQLPSLSIAGTFSDLHSTSTIKLSWPKADVAVALSLLTYTNTLVLALLDAIHLMCSNSLVCRTPNLSSTKCKSLQRSSDTASTASRQPLINPPPRNNHRTAFGVPRRQPHRLLSLSWHKLTTITTCPHKDW